MICRLDIDVVILSWKKRPHNQHLERMVILIFFSLISKLTSEGLSVDYIVLVKIVLCDNVMIDS